MFGSLHAELLRSCSHVHMYTFRTLHAATPLLSSSLCVACVAGTHDLWDRSGVAQYISTLGDFQATFSSFPPHLISTCLHIITVDTFIVCNVEVIRRIRDKMNQSVLFSRNELHNTTHSTCVHGVHQTRSTGSYVEDPDMVYTPQ